MPEKKLSIKEWSDSDKPREKLISNGVMSLSDSELLAILIATGSGKDSAIDLARNVINTYKNNLAELSTITIENLQQIKGIGKAKAATILAAIELGRRVQLAVPDRKQIIKTTDQAFDLFDHIKFLDHEEVWLACLSAKSELLDLSCIHKGGMQHVLVDSRLIFAKALEKKSTQIILAHNHPTGNALPSDEDKLLTKRIKQAGELLQIKLADHVILSRHDRYSFTMYDLI